MDTILQKFTEILCGSLDNQQQIKEEKATGKQLHPYAKHVTAICNHKIINKPNNNEGIYILEESYYIYPEKDTTELKPLLFYVRSYKNSKVLLQSIQIPERFAKEEVTNNNDQLIFDWNELKTSSFGTATYLLHSEGYFTCLLYTSPSPRD